MQPRHDFRLIRFLLVHAVVGTGIALAAVALLLAGDVAGLRGLVARSDAGLLALGVMTAFFIITFASVQMSVALAIHLAQPPSGRAGRAQRPVPVPRLRPIPVAAARPSRAAAR